MSSTSLKESKAVHLHEVTVGMSCLVRFGAAQRPGVVEEILFNGKVGVRFVDVDASTAKNIPASRRGHLFGAVVRPQAITCLPTSRTTSV